jgi:hypothetical protein
MRNISQERFIPTNVLIEFEDVSFRVPRGATFADISENLDRIGMWHQGQPISIDMRFKALEEKARPRRADLLRCCKPHPESEVVNVSPRLFL